MVIFVAKIMFFISLLKFLNADVNSPFFWPLVISYLIIIAWDLDKRKKQTGRSVIFMEYPNKEVRFDLYCDRCKYKEKDDYGEPCFSCLDEPVREYSHRPINWKERE